METEVFRVDVTFEITSDAVKSFENADVNHARRLGDWWPFRRHLIRAVCSGWPSTVL